MEGYDQETLWGLGGKGGGTGRAVLTRDDPHASNALLPSDAILRCFGCGRLDDAPVGVDCGGGDLAGGVGVEEEGDACGALVMDIPSVSDDGGCLEGPFGSESAGSDWERGFVYMCVGGRGENEKLTEPPYQRQLDHRCLPCVEKSLELGREESRFREHSSRVHLIFGV